MQHVLIIGNGITGTLCGSILTKKFPDLKVRIWDKARGAGGRMTTKYGVDLGAQYISTTKEKLQQYQEFYTPLISKSLLVPLKDTSTMLGLKNNPDTIHFYPEKGMSAVVKHFIPVTVDYEHQVSKIVEENGKYRVFTDKKDELFDFVISTMPIPQFIDLKGPKLTPEEFESLQKINYSSRFVLVWSFEPETVIPKTSWTVQYIEDDIIRYISLEHVFKRITHKPTLLFHSSVAFGMKNREKTKEEMKMQLEEAAKRLLPDWPRPNQVFVHKWKFSQVLTGFLEGRGCLALEGWPGIVLAGDAFTQSNFDGCIESAEAAVDTLSRLIKK